MNRSLPESTLRARLESQLVLFGEEKKKFLDEYFPVYGKKRIDISHYLSEYAVTVDKLLQTVEDDTALHQRVWVGSEVTLSYLPDMGKERFVIELPNLANADDNQISFLSPVGMTLLLAEKGDVVTIETPSAVVRVRIDDIRLTPEPFGAWML
ncbi:GreA/GreB family elongation factor [Paenibacillus sp. NPDC058071]|uniref:GreA/GreB family elongation factor n=1 Tax=Paenibacillus sp. NPDC058071 TaxID=3346326 RepID=UPI0036DF86B5